jgi:hypothetical protein
MSGMRIMNGRSGPRGTVLEGSKDYAIWWGEGSTREGGGWLYQARTLFKESGGATYFYRITSEQMALTFVPAPSALTAS